MKFEDFKETITEGVYDPGIFKAFFLAGGSGSGKSYSAEKTTGSAAGEFEWLEAGNKIKPGKTGPFGLKIVNSDEQLEFALMKAEMSADFTKYTDDETTKKEIIRKKAKAVTKKREALWIAGRLGLILDGTGKNPTKLTLQKSKLEDIGYDAYMIFVNTSLDIALERNHRRKRRLHDDVVRSIWGEVQQVKNQLANIFSSGFIEIVNNRASEDVFRKTFVEVQKLIKRSPTNAKARAWIAHELEQKSR